MYSVPHDVTQNSVTDGNDVVTRPGSPAEHLLQCTYGSEDRAARFYADQLRDRLLPAMVEFVGRMEMMFLSTSGGRGECDASLRAGPAGFIRVLDDRHLAYPEYRGNGVHASLANISENPHVGLLMMDFERDLIGLHVNGRARIVDDEIMRALHPDLPADPARGRRVERWVVVEVAEAYIHCRKHIPRMTRVRKQRDWGTDDPARKGGDYFGARRGADPAAGSDRSPALGAQTGADGDGAPGLGARHHGTGYRDSGSGEDAPDVDRRVDPPTSPFPIPGQRPAPPSAGTAEFESRPSARRFPSTTHLPAGAATARPLRANRPCPDRPHRRIRWLSS